MWLPVFVRKLVKHTDKTSSRYALGGVRYEADECGAVRLTATDGKQLITVTHEDGGSSETGDWIVEGESLDNAYRAVCPNAKTKASVSFQDNHAVVFGKGNMTADFCEGRFPDVGQAIRHCGIEAGPRMVVDAKLLKLFCETVIEASKGNFGNTAKIALQIPNDNGKALQMIACSSDGAVIRGLLMPITDDEDLSGLEMAHDDLSSVATPTDSEADDSADDADVDEADDFVDEVVAVESGFVNGMMPA